MSQSPPAVSGAVVRGPPPPAASSRRLRSAGLPQRSDPLPVPGGALHRTASSARLGRAAGAQPRAVPSGYLGPDSDDFTRELAYAEQLDSAVAAGAAASVDASVAASDAVFPEGSPPVGLGLVSLPPVPKPEPAPPFERASHFNVVFCAACHKLCRYRESVAVSSLTGIDWPPYSRVCLACR